MPARDAMGLILAPEWLIGPLWGTGSSSRLCPSIHRSRTGRRFTPCIPTNASCRPSEDVCGFLANRYGKGYHWGSLQEQPGVRRHDALALAIKNPAHAQHDAVESRRGGGGGRLPVAMAGAFAATPRSGLPWPRFPSPLIEPDVPISGIRLSDWLHRKAHGWRPLQAGISRPHRGTNRPSPCGRAPSEAFGYILVLPGS